MSLGVIGGRQYLGAHQAVQLGLRGATLEAFATREIIEVIDFSGFVASQRPFASDDRSTSLHTPIENVYCPA